MELKPGQAYRLLSGDEVRVVRLLKHGWLKCYSFTAKVARIYGTYGFVQRGVERIACREKRETVLS